MIVSLIVAIDEKNGMGKDNKLPWHLPADLKHFKSLTTGHSILMGRKTFDSIGKALPNRRNILISRQQDLVVEGAEVAWSLNEAFGLCKDEDEVFVIGGAQIFEQSLPYAEILYLTLIHHNFDADTFFPDIDKTTWVEEQRIRHEPDEKNNYSYTFIKCRKA
ncbi:MAG: dihydrofolate reductase [Daejeonella sp.]